MFYQGNLYATDRKEKKHAFPVVFYETFHTMNGEYILQQSPVFIEVISFGGSIDSGGLTYFVREDLESSIQLGCLVEVPFRNSLEYAIVTKVQCSLIPDNPKSIVRIVTTTPLLSGYQISVIFYCATYYFVHAHHILSLFLSKSLVKYLEKKDFHWLDTIPVVTKLPNNLWINFYHHISSTDFTDIIPSYIYNKTVIILPDDYAIEAYVRKNVLDPVTTLVIPDALTDTKKYKAFMSVYSGDKNIIIWTRRLLYYNLMRYDTILYIEDAMHRTAMRFWHSYKHLDVLRAISREKQFHISILTTLPSIESMYLLHTGIYETNKKC
jgi:primosomal protein N'